MKLEFYGKIIISNAAKRGILKFDVIAVSVSIIKALHLSKLRPAKNISRRREAAWYFINTIKLDINCVFLYK